MDDLKKYYYPIISLNDIVLNNQEKFVNYFKTLSGNKFFILPPEILTLTKQNEYNDKKEIEDNNIMNSFKINNSNLINNKINNKSLENNSSNNTYNKTQYFIDLPKWAKQPKNSKLCFSINELFLAFIEQNIVVHYIIYCFDNQYFHTMINDNTNILIEEFINLKSELKDFLGINKENLFDLLNLDSITKEIYYNSDIEKFVDNKKYQENLIFKTKCWKENINLEEENTK